MDANFNAINERISYAEHMIKFYEGFNQRSAYAIYWNEYKKYLETFKKNGEVKSLSKDARFAENNYTRDAAKWIKENYRIDTYFGDGYVGVMESKQDKVIIESISYKNFGLVKYRFDKVAKRYNYPLKEVSRKDIEKVIDYLKNLEHQFEYGEKIELEDLDEAIKEYLGIAGNPKYKESKQDKVIIESDTFKCPECGGKVLSNTKYCMSCKKKVKEESKVVNENYDHLQRQKDLIILCNIFNKISDSKHSLVKCKLDKDSGSVAKIIIFSNDYFLDNKKYDSGNAFIYINEDLIDKILTSEAKKLGYNGVSYNNIGSIFWLAAY